MDLLEERAKTHGDYAENAHISQSIKTIISNSPDYEDVPPIHKESLDLICTKIGRILSGNCNEPDHWRDIAGYAQLVVNNLEASKECHQIDDGERMHPVLSNNP